MSTHDHSGHSPHSIVAHSTIDIHAHWYPQDWLRLIEKDGPAQGASLKRDGRKYHISTGRVTNAFDESFVALDERIAGMDRQHVDVQAMSLTTPMVYWAPPAFGLALAQCFNDSIAAAHAKDPSACWGWRCCRCRIRSSRCRNWSARRNCPECAASTSRRT